MSNAFATFIYGCPVPEGSFKRDSDGKVIRGSWESHPLREELEDLCEADEGPHEEMTTRSGSSSSPERTRKSIFGWGR